jgi:hypothetical protein
MIGMGGTALTEVKIQATVTEELMAQFKAGFSSHASLAWQTAPFGLTLDSDN